MPNPFYPRAPREWWPILNTSADCAGATPVWPLTADAPNVVLDLYPLRGGLEGGQAGEHVRLANRAFERLMRSLVFPITRSATRLTRG